MTNEAIDITERLHAEIDRTPERYRPLLLRLVHSEQSDIGADELLRMIHDED